MSEGIQRASGTQLRNILRTMTKNRFIGVLTGFFTTALVQSSSATTVMTVSFVNAGLVTLVESAGIMMGANIGTTMSAWIISLIGQIQLSYLSIPLFALGVPLVLMRRGVSKYWGEFIIGFGILFLSINFLQEAIPNIIIGVAWMVLLLPVFLPWISDFVDQFRGLFAGHLDTPENLSVLDENMYFILAAFHTIFNLLNVLLLIGFVQLLVKASIWSIPDDEEEEDKARLKFISTSNRTPELATNELMNATAHFGSVVSEMNIFSKDLLNSTDLKAINKLLDRIKKYEKIADRIEAEITEYISKLSDTEITQLTSNRLRNILNICHDLERTADLYYQISLLLLEKSEKRVYFLPYQRNNLNALFDLLNEALHVMKVNLSVPDYKTVDPQSAAAVETNINEMIIKIRSQILDGINQDGYNANSTIVYNDIFNLLEKIGDQIFSVTKSIIIDK